MAKKKEEIEEVENDEKLDEGEKSVVFLRRVDVVIENEGSEPILIKADDVEK